MQQSPIGAVVIACAAACAARADGPFFIGLGHLPGGGLKESEAAAVSDDGSVVVGRSNSAQGGQAFRWTLAGGILGLGDLPGGNSFSMATGVSGDGSTVVGISSSEDSYKVHQNASEGFRWREAEGMIGIGVTPNEWFTWPVAASHDGSVIVGNTLPLKPFRWTEEDGLVALPLGVYMSGQVRDVSADGSRAVGGVTPQGGTFPEAALWEGDGVVTIGDLEGGGVNSLAMAVSAPGLVIVGNGDADHGGGNLRDEAFRWTERGGMEALGDLPGNAFFSNAVAVSDDGARVAGMSFADAGNRPFIWDAEHGMRDLLDVLAKEHGLELGGWGGFVLTDMSADGRAFVGFAMNPQGAKEAWIAHLGKPGACYPDCDGSETLNLFDFLCFTNLFNGADPAADCDASGSLNLFDFLCFVSAFNAGC